MCVVLLAVNDRVSLHLGSWSRVVRGAAPVVRVYEKYMEGASAVYGRCTTLAVPFCVPEHAGRAGGSGWVVLAWSFPVEGSPAAGGAFACGFGVLYGPVRGCPQDRRRGWPGVCTYNGQRRRRGYHIGLFPQVRAMWRSRPRRVCVM